MSTLMSSWQYVLFFSFCPNCTWQFLMPPFSEVFQPSPGISFPFPSTNLLYLLLFGQSTQSHWPPFSILLLTNFLKSPFFLSAYRELSATKDKCPGTRTRILQFLAPFLSGPWRCSLVPLLIPSISVSCFSQRLFQNAPLSSRLPQHQLLLYTLLKRNPKKWKPFCGKSFHALSVAHRSLSLAVILTPNSSQIAAFSFSPRWVTSKFYPHQLSVEVQPRGKCSCCLGYMEVRVPYPGLRSRQDKGKLNQSLGKIKVTGQVFRVWKNGQWWDQSWGCQARAGSQEMVSRKWGGRRNKEKWI